MSKIALPNNENTDRLLAKIESALQRSDEKNRHERARRILWKGQFESVDAHWMDLDTSHVFDEAKSCFVDGHHIATIVLATGFMEHILADMLGTVGKESLKVIIKKANARELMPAELLNRLDNLKEVRNAFVHRKEDNPEEQEHTLGQRSVAKLIHPQDVFVKDAQEALSLMYAYFHYVVANGSQR